MYSGGGGGTGMAALKRRRTLLLLSSNMAVVPPYRSACRFIDLDGLADPGDDLCSPTRPEIHGPTRTIPLRHQTSHTIYVCLSISSV